MAGGTTSRWPDHLLDGMRNVGDPVADIPVGNVLRAGGVAEVNTVMRRLVRADQSVPPGLPDELKRYFADTLPLPTWADAGEIERGQRVFEKWGIYIALSLYCASLPSSYAAAKGVQVLHLTARLDTDPRHRILETGQFLFDVLSEGGLGTESRGRRSIQRVRLMHAAVRHLITERARTTPGLWNPEWGTPLNQEDLAGTLLAFSGVVDEPLRRLGVRLRRKDISAYRHLWNVIGHLLGVREEMLAHDPDEATELMNTIRRRQFRASEEGQALTRSLLTLLDEMTPLHRFDDTIPPLIRHMIGDEVADLLAIPDTDVVDELSFLARHIDWFLLHILGWTERDSRRYHLMAQLARPFGIDLLRTLFALETRGKPAPFDIPDRLAQRWDLDDRPR